MKKQTKTKKIPDSEGLKNPWDFSSPLLQQSLGFLK